MDTEGTDSNQRSEEDYEVFERVVTCFSLCMSDVLIINIKWDEIERRNGSNITLLKTIIAVYQDIFGKSEMIIKKKLVFLVRDSRDSEAQQDKIKNSLKDKLKENWEGVSPNGRRFKDYFSTEFIFLVSIENKNFDKEIDSLRDRFNRKAEDCIFLKDKSDRLMFYDLPEYFENCLAKIQSKSEL